MLRGLPRLLPPVPLPLGRAGDDAGPVPVHSVVTVQDLPQQDLVLSLYLVPLLSLVFADKPAETALSHSLQPTSSQSHLEKHIPIHHTFEMVQYFIVSILVLKLYYYRNTRGTHL